MILGLTFRSFKIRWRLVKFGWLNTVSCQPNAHSIFFYIWSYMIYFHFLVLGNSAQFSSTNHWSLHSVRALLFLRICFTYRNMHAVITLHLPYRASPLVDPTYSLPASRETTVFAVSFTIKTTVVLKFYIKTGKVTLQSGLNRKFL